MQRRPEAATLTRQSTTCRDQRDHSVTLGLYLPRRALQGDLDGEQDRPRGQSATGGRDQQRCVAERSCCGGRAVEPQVACRPQQQVPGGLRPAAAGRDPGLVPRVSCQQQCGRHVEDGGGDQKFLDGEAEACAVLDLLDGGAFPGQSVDVHRLGERLT
nr:hypothetical protein [Pseudonocardia sp. ICBG601]